MRIGFVLDSIFSLTVDRINKVIDGLSDSPKDLEAYEKMIVMGFTEAMSPEVSRLYADLINRLIYILSAAKRSEAEDGL